MLSAIRSVMAGPSHQVRPSTSEYQAVSVGDELSAEDELGLKDRHDVKVYLCFWALGAGVLMSWNALICTIPLLTTFFPLDNPVRTSLASYLSSSYCFGNLFFLGLAQRSVGKTSPSKRLHYALLLLLLTSLVLTFPLLSAILPKLAPTPLLATLILLTLVLSLSTAYLQSAVFALASLWGSNEMIAVMSGQGGIAVLVSAVQLALAVLSAGGHGQAGDQAGENGDPQASKMAGVGLWALGSLGTVGCLVAHRYLVHHPEYTNVLASVINRREVEGIGADIGLENVRKGGVTRTVLRKNMLLEIAVAWVFVVTLSVFPPVTTTILSTRHPVPRLLQPDVFIPLHFLIFNGPTSRPSPACSSPRLRESSSLSILRTLFIPLLFLCNVTSSSSSQPSTDAHTPLFNSDLAYLSIIILFGLTNGYIGSLCMIVASSPELNPKLDEDERDVAGTLASFCLVAGLAGGSLASFGVSRVMHG